MNPMFRLNQKTIETTDEGMVIVTKRCAVHNLTALCPLTGECLACKTKPIRKFISAVTLDRSGTLSDHAFVDN